MFSRRTVADQGRCSWIAPNTAACFRPKLVGRPVGRKFGFLYDEYVKYAILSACVVNKADKSMVLHTQEAHGSSPCAPTIRINKI